MLRLALVGCGTIAALFVLVFAGRALFVGVDEEPLYTIEHTIEIAAEPAEVWAVLAAFEHYPDWNPYAVSIEGRPGFEERLVVTLEQDDWENPVVVTPTILKFEPGRTLGWQGRVLLPGIHDTFHVWELTELSAGGTRLRQYEDFRGWLARFVPASADRPAIERAFRAMNEALKARVENTR